MKPPETGPDYVVSDSGQLTTEADPNSTTLNVSHDRTPGLLAAMTGASRDCDNSYPRKQTMIGAGFHRKAHVPLKLTYYRGSTSELEVGAKYGREGWEIGGSVRKSNSGGSGTQWITTGLKDKFHYTVYEVKHTRCNLTCTSGPSCWYEFEEYRAVRYIGGNKSGKPRWYPVINRRNCVPYRPGGPGYELIVDESRAVKYQGGIRIQIANWTLSLGAQSGFNEDTKYLGDVKRERQICGWIGPPGDRPGLIQVGKPG